MGVKMPALFLGHGSPMNIIDRNSFTEVLSGYQSRLPRPSAIMVVSAHWSTKGTFVTYNEHPKTIYDFYGFPDELYQLEYPCPGAPVFAELVRDTVKSVEIGLATDWGLDHASWSVLRHLYPDAEIPVFEMSLDYTKPLPFHYNLARELSPLREQGVMIIGSGNIVHNLRMTDFDDINAQPYDWAIDFDQAVKNCLTDHRHQELIGYDTLPGAQQAVPTNEHYLPMLYTIGLQGKDEPVEFIYKSFQNASMSMRCFRVG